LSHFVMFFVLLVNEGEDVVAEIIHGYVSLRFFMEKSENVTWSVTTFLALVKG
jgi:hypothetical protein